LKEEKAGEVSTNRSETPPSQHSSSRETKELLAVQAEAVIQAERKFLLYERALRDERGASSSQQ